MGRLSRLTGRRQEGNSAVGGETTSERIAEFERVAAKLRADIAALRSELDGLRERDSGEVSSEPAEAPVEPPLPVDEPTEEEQPPAETAVLDAPGSTVDGSEPEVAASGEGALDPSAAEPKPAPDASEADGDSAKSAADAGSAGGQRGRLRRVGRRGKHRKETVTRTCMVCGSTFSGTEDELRTSGELGGGDLYLCASCQGKGWVLPN